MVASQILIVDDEPLNRQILSLMLKSLGYEVVEAENGEQALYHIFNNTFHLVLLDLGLPDISGIEVLKIIANMKDFKVPIIIHTASVQDVLKNTCLQFGVFDYLLKPYDLDSLEKVVRNAIR